MFLAAFEMMDKETKTFPENLRSEPQDQIPMVNAATFADLVTTGVGPIAVEFMSYRCGYCRTLDPVLQQAAKILSPKMTTFKVNIIKDQDLANQFGVKVTPTLLMFLNGKQLGQSEGPHPTVANLLAVMQAPFPSLQ